MYPGAFCAFGAICADMKSDYSESIMKPLDALGPQGLQASFRRLEERAAQDLVEQGVRREGIQIERFYHGMYAGQTWDNRNPAPAGNYDGGTLDEIKLAFHESYFRTYGYNAEELSVVVTSTMVVATARGPAVELSHLDGVDGLSLEDALAARGDIYLKGKKYAQVPFYERTKLPPHRAIAGPAIIHDGYSTTVVREQDSAHVDKYGILRIRVAQ
jgi:N-methylhydantoinase A